MGDFSRLEGEVIEEITGAIEPSESVTISCKSGLHVLLSHYQECCESVSLQEVHGTPEDLIGATIASAYESCNEKHREPEYPDSYTWTFYRLVTNQGALVLRWLGESNGYYSESVDVEVYEPEQW